MGAVSLSSKLALVNAALDKMSISGITAPPEVQRLFSPVTAVRGANV